MPPYMPMYGYNQPVMSGNYFQGLTQQRSYTTPSPNNFNYPKLMNYRGNQYNNYPKFKQTKEEDEKTVDITANLTKELEKQIKELQNLTKEAKELAKKKQNEINSKNNNQIIYKNEKINNSFSKSNLDNITLLPEQKIKFDEKIKHMIEKLDKLK